MKKKVLLAGIGGSTHAVARALSTSRLVGQIECTSFNTGVNQIARCHDVELTDFNSIADLAESIQADVVIPSSGDHLALGIADAIAARGIPVFGPRKSAAKLEGSKAFLKEIARARGVAIPAYDIIETSAEARSALANYAPPYVIKSSGHAKAEGVRICADVAEAEDAISSIGKFRSAGIADTRILIEEFIGGKELSLFGVADGISCRLLTGARDFKRAETGDTGANTSGMGAFSPVADVCVREQLVLFDEFVTPIFEEVSARGAPFVGIIYAGLKEAADGWRLLEMNVRLGDPEAQVVLPRITSDVGELVFAAVEGRLDECSIQLSPTSYVTVALTRTAPIGAAPAPIFGLEKVEARNDAHVIHAGMNEIDGRLVTKSGRIMHVVGSGETVPNASRAAYEAIEDVSFEGKSFRLDIGRNVWGQ